MSTLRQQILAAWKARAEAILVANGFATDAGLRVEHRMAVPTEDDPTPLIYVYSAPAVIVAQDDVIIYDWALYATVFTKTASADPLDDAELLLGDLERAMFLADRRLGDILRANRNVGDVLYGDTGVEGPVIGGRFVTAWVEAMVRYTTRYGQPAAA